jgi:anion-transporting  ArsA/GET3 family ATPase
MGSSLLDKRLIFVTGKGGVGKSTVALALGLLAAQRGQRVVITELAGNDELQRTFGLPGGRRFTEVRLSENLFTISIEPEAAMEEYLKVKLPGPAGAALSQSKLFGVFAMATPGMRELLTMGKVWELSQLERRTPEADGYDLVLVDAPASGHGVGILRTPRTFAEIAKVGPIANQGMRIAETIADRDFTGVIAVTTPEEMPVNEIFQVKDELSDDGLGLDAVIINARLSDSFDQPEIERISRAADGVGTAAPALAAAQSEHKRRANQLEQEQRLTAVITEPLLKLPYLFVPEIDRYAIAELAKELDGQLR